MFLQIKEIYPPLSFTTVTVDGETTNTVTINTVFISNLPCKVCEGKGLVYGLDGKPYLCPKCDGDKVDKNKQTYPYYPSYPTVPWVFYGDVSPELQPVTTC